MVAFGKMAKFVLAGLAGCPAYARAEMLADTLAARLPHFNVNKVVQSTSEWRSWLAHTCEERNWTHSDSPLVWRELVDTGGKGLYLGGLKAFEEYSEHYYGVIPSTTPELEVAIAAENEVTLEKQREAEGDVPARVAFRVCVTNASSHLAYQVLYQLATGQLLGTTRLGLHLYQHEGDKEEECQDICVALQDLASPYLDYVQTASSLNEAMTDADLVVILDWNYCSANIQSCSPSEHAQGSDVMVVTSSRYRDYARCINARASPDVRVCVTGCVANVGVAVMVACEPTLSQRCIAAPSLAEIQAVTVLSHRLKVDHQEISKVTIWGHTHNKILADNSFTRVKHFPGAVVGPDPFDLPLSRCEFDRKWLNEEFPALVLDRHQHSCHGDGPALAEAAALIQLMRKWILPEEWHKDGEEEDLTTEEMTEGETTGGEETAEEGTGEETTGEETAEEGTGEETTGEETAEEVTGEETTGEETAEEVTGEETTGEETVGEETAGEETAGEETAGKGSERGSGAEDSELINTKPDTEPEERKEQDREKTTDRDKSNDQDKSGSASSKESNKRVSIEVKISEDGGSKEANNDNNEGTSKVGGGSASVVGDVVAPSSSAASTDRRPTTEGATRTEDTTDSDTQAGQDDLVHTGVWHSVGVVSNGSGWHGIPAGVVACVPCQCKDGVWRPVPDVPVAKHLQGKFKTQVNTLQQELQVAMASLQ